MDTPDELKWVKEHDLAHGEFGKWLEEVKMNQSQGRKFMTISEKLNERSMSNVLGTEALYLVATMPEEERDKPQQLYGIPVLCVCSHTPKVQT